MTKNIIPGSWLLTAALAGLSIAYLWLVFLPNNRNIGELKRQLLDKQSYVGDATTLPAKIEVARSDFKNADAYVRDWASALPAGGDLLPMVGAIHREVQLAGATVTQLEPQAEVPMQSIRQMSILLVCRGEFAQIEQAVGQLQQLPGTVWLDTVRIKPISKDGKDVQCEVNLVIFADKLENSG